MAQEKYKATVNDPQDEKKLKQQETKETVEEGAKALATVYLNANGVEGPLADIVVDKVAENKNVQRALNIVSKNKQVQKTAEKAKPMVDMAKPLLDAKKGSTGGISSGGKTSLGSNSSGIGKIGKFGSTSSKKGVSDSTGSLPDTEKTFGNNNPLKNPFSNKGGNSKESTELKVIKFFAQNPYLLVPILIVLLLFLIIGIILFSGEDVGNDSNLYYTYEQCKEITVKNADGSLEKPVTLEKYVEGVIAGEINFMNDLTTYKALAVAARSYVIYNTKSCTEPILNSSAKQNYKPDLVTDLMEEAVLNTAGQILKDENGEILGTEYDAFKYKINGENYELIQPTDSSKERLEIPKDWAEALATSEGSSVEWLNDNSHGRGMSQYGAYYLSTVKKWDYEKILHYFYGDDVTISIMISAGSGEGLVQNSNGFLMRIGRPQRSNSYFYTQDSNNFGLGGNEGECAWYAVHRTNEIISTNGLSDQYKTVIRGGNGGEFCTASDYDQFEKSYNLKDTNIQPGTLFSTRSSKEGHVEIIENVIRDSSGNIITVQISEGYLKLGGISDAEKMRIWNMVDGSYKKLSARKKVCEGNNSGCFQFKEKTYKEFINYLSERNFQCFVFISKNKNS